MSKKSSTTHAEAAAKLAIYEKPIGSLRPNPRNPRQHSEKQVRQIAKCIEEVGFTNPILIDEADNIIAGHGRLEAAKLLGRSQVSTICLEHLSKAQIRAYSIADNKLAENAGWDNELLGIELQYLTEIDIDFDVTITGFELPEIDFLIEALENGDGDDGDEVPVTDNTVPPVTGKSCSKSR